MKMTISELQQPLTEEERREIEALDDRAIIFDEDSPEMTPEMLMQFKHVNREKRTKQTVSIRLSPKAMEFSRAYGKGYTSFLSRLVDAALEDEKLVKQCV